MVTSPLAAKGITVVETFTPKQTETTQRWTAGLRVAGLRVAGLRVAGLAVPVRTKIEFSRRGAARRGAARDVFDLSLLLAREDAAGLTLTEAERARVPDAVDRALSVSFDDYVSKVTAPFDSYLSLHTALHLHGLVEQIPEVFYVATQGRTQRATTNAGTFSLHHLAPEVFGGFEETPAGLRLATTEKALFDFAYLAAGRSRLFATLPELELPRGFKESEARRWLRKIPSARSRTLTDARLTSFLTRARAAAGTDR